MTFALQEMIYLVTDIHNTPLFTVVARGINEAMPQIQEHCVANNITEPVRVYLETGTSPYTPERH